MRIFAPLAFSLAMAAGTLVAAEISFPRISVKLGATVVQTELILAAKGAQIAALQVDIIPAAGLAVTAEIGAAASGAQKQLVAGDVAGGKRLVIFGINQDSIRDGALVTLSITFPNQASGSYALRLVSAVASDPLGTEVTLESRDGSILVGERPLPVRLH